MKNLVKFLLLLALLLPLTAIAHDFEVDGIYYNIDGSNAYVTYRGDTYNQYANEYTGDVTIPSAVTFNGTTYPVTEIGGQAFVDCIGLNSVTIPNSITKIGTQVFDNCTGLNTMTIPNSVTFIGSFAFVGCTGLTSVTIGSSVTSIGDYVFNGCSGLNYIAVESGNTCYDSRDNCNAIIETATNTLITGCKNTVIPASVTTIGGESFLGCSGLTTLSIPNSVTKIGNGAFYGCIGLTSVTIPNTVTSIGSNAFSSCTGLSSVTIECGNIYGSGSGAFSNCTAIEDVIVRQAFPPNVANDFFDDGTYQSATLHVPTGRTVFFRENNVWNKFTNIVEEDMPDVEIDSSPFNNLYSRRLILSYTDRGDSGGSWGQPGVAEIVHAVKFPVERMSRIKGNEITHIRFNLWGRYSHVSNLKIYMGSTRDKRDLAYQSVDDLHEGWNEVALNEPYLITGDSIFVGVEYLKGAEDMLCPVMWDPYAGNEEGACLAVREGKWENGRGTWYIQCMVEGDQVPKYDVHFEEIIAPRYNKAIKAGEPFEFRIELRNWGSMPIDHYEIQAQLDGTDIDFPQISQTIKRGGGLQEFYLRAIPDEGTPPGCYQFSVTPRSLNGVEFTSVEAPLVTLMKVYEHDMGRQKILVQVYSGSWCGYCPGFDSLLEQKRQERDDLAVVDIHSNDPFFMTPASESYVSMLYTDGIPNVDLNRCVWKTPYNFREYILNERLDDAKNQPAFATVNIVGSFNEENHMLDLTVSGERNEDFLPVEGWTNLTVLLVEDDIISGQAGYVGPYHHPAVLRTAISDIWGDPVQWTGDKYEMHYSMSMDDLTNCGGSWNIENMRVVAFLGKPFTGDNYDEICVVNCNEYLIYDKYAGDVNGDHEVNIADINAVIGMILSGAPEPSGDANRDGEVNIADINVIIQAILNH